MATGGKTGEFKFTEEEIKIIEATRKLKIENVEEFEERIHEKGHIPTPFTTLVESKGSNPNISVFYGEQGKGDVNFKTWVYEVKCMMGKYSEEQILNAIRHSVRGEAANRCWCESS